MNSLIFVIPAVLAYLAAAGVLSYRLLHRNPERPGRVVGIALCLVGLLFHAGVLWLDIYADHGVNLGFFNAFSLVTWTILLLLMLSSINKPVEVLGIPLLPLAALTVLLEIYYPASRLLGPDTHWGLVIHITISILAYSLLALASLQALALAIQDHQLHNRHPGGLIRVLPPLQTMETLLFEMIGLGFLLLTAALASGFAFLDNMFEQHLAHKTILSLIAWVVFGILLVGRFRAGWRGKTAIIWTLSGFVVLMLAYFGSKFVLELIQPG
jgi:ABC-type uncharacterized transport system permease subunit